MGEQDHGHELQIAVWLSWCHGVHVIGVSGEVGQDTIEPLRSALSDDVAVEVGGTVVDLRGVTFFGSGGVNLLAHAHQQATCRGGAVAVVAAQRAVLRPLTVTGLRQVIGCHSSLGDAVAAVRRIAG
ncbi:STAS domain-containing protein [Lentzea aerocolonigenes]|uniref:STAS domain-containing protein n=1 Tax=Lentzea aerocolonigenes TaxID=68170 RepID=UPI0004C3888A|nr:STAS domain-containing protein [Lentzea aerocolonigenes]MCP2242355.1 anti-anti-sigma factor [Lentzea aerocolonigenes]